MSLWDRAYVRVRSCHTHVHTVRQKYTESQTQIRGEKRGQTWTDKTLPVNIHRPVQALA